MQTAQTRCGILGKGDSSSRTLPETGSWQFRVMTGAGHIKQGRLMKRGDGALWDEKLFPQSETLTDFPRQSGRVIVFEPSSKCMCYGVRACVCGRGGAIMTATSLVDDTFYSVCQIIDIFTHLSCWQPQHWWRVVGNPVAVSGGFSSSNVQMEAGEAFSWNKQFCSLREAAEERSRTLSFGIFILDQLAP